MLNKNELITIILATLILGFSISLVETTEIFIYTSITIFLILIINIFAKKITSYYLDSKIEIKLESLMRTYHNVLINVELNILDAFSFSSIIG